MSRTLYSIKESGSRKKVKITNDGYGLEMYTMRNGFQWSGCGVDDELLHMIKSAIEEYFEIIDKEQI